MPPKINADAQAKAKAKASAKGGGKGGRGDGGGRRQNDDGHRRDRGDGGGGKGGGDRANDPVDRFAQRMTVDEVLRLITDYAWGVDDLTKIADAASTQRVEAGRRVGITIQPAPRQHQATDADGACQHSDESLQVMSADDLRKLRRTARRRWQATKATKGEGDDSTNRRLAYVGRITAVMESKGINVGGATGGAADEEPEFG